jgi:hypothetical protein
MNNYRKAIICKYLPCANTKPSRLKAYDLDGNSVTVPFHRPGMQSGSSEPYEYAARKFMEKYEWKGEIRGGYTKEGMVFVFI